MVKVHLNNAGRELGCVTIVVRDKVLHTHSCVKNQLYCLQPFIGPLPVSFRLSCKRK